MAFCTQCGTQVGDQDLYCSNCGRPQRGAGPAPSAGAAWPGAGPTRSSFAPPPTPPFPPPPFPGAAGKPHAHREFLAGWEDNKVAAMCYIPVIGWIFAIIVLAAERFRHVRDARFHAFQGLYLFVMWLVVDWVFGPIARASSATHDISKLIQLVLIGTGIFMFIKTRQGEFVQLPVLGELAEKSVSEQK
jgi:uncharacterized membrane protein